MKIISSAQNALIKHCIKIREQKKYRELHHELLIVGSQLVKEISSLTSPQALFFSHPEECNLSCKESYLLPPSLLQKMAGLPTFSGVIALFKTPAPQPLAHKEWLLVLESLRDPGNLGTLLRSAAALGWEGVFVLPQCADLFNDKVIRASRGALFHLPYAFGTPFDLHQLLEREGLPLFVAHIKGKSLKEQPPLQRAALLLSNEAAGPSPESLGRGTPLTIPLSPLVESLNVATAGAILMYQLKGALS